jgi:hypothetical protein
MHDLLIRTKYFLDWNKYKMLKTFLIFGLRANCSITGEYLKLICEFTFSGDRICAKKYGKYLL